MLGISQQELALASGVSKGTIAGFEMARRDTLPAIRDALRRALETRYIEFKEPEDSHYGGVVLLKEAYYWDPGPDSPQDEADNHEFY